MKIFSALAILLLTLTACNTVQGVGEDVKSGGEAIKKGAREVQDAL